MPIFEYLEKNAAKYPDEVAIVERTACEGASVRETMTWGEMNRHANKFANALKREGIKRGDKVAVLMYNCNEWIPIYLGILKTGALAVPMNFRYEADEIVYCLDLAEVNMLVFGHEFVDRIKKRLSGIQNDRELVYYGTDCPEFAEDYNDFIKDASEENLGITITDDDYAAIYFSSGTTGFPKAILHKHESLSQAADVEQVHHNITKDDNFLLIPPLYHAGAFIFWLGNLKTASKAVLLKGTKPKIIFDAVSEEKCTMAFLLVPWVQDILDAIDSGEIDLSKYDLDSWRLMHMGAQPIPPSLVRKWQEIFPKMGYDTTYGLTEATGPNCLHLGMENVHKVGSIGKAGYRWEIKIVDKEDEIVKIGEVGELCVRGRGVMNCYYNNFKATSESIISGWLHTGDMAKQDEDGFVYLVDRKKDLIVCGGENIYPVQIEDFLHKHEMIKDVAVIGLPDRRLGEKIAAIIEFKDGQSCTKEDIEKFCEGLPRYKRPKEIFFDDVPRNATGKLEKPKLRAKYGADRIVAKEYQLED